MHSTALLRGFKTDARHLVRIAAIVQDPKTIPLLIKGLEDPDPRTKYHALAALAMMTHKGGDFGPGGLAFERDPGKYVRLWKHWWETQGEAEYGQASEAPKP